MTASDELTSHPDFPFKWHKGRIADGAGAIFYSDHTANSLRFFKKGGPAYFTQIGHKVIFLAGELSQAAIRMATVQLGISLIEGPFTKPHPPTQAQLNSLIAAQGVKL